MSSSPLSYLYAFPARVEPATGKDAVHGGLSLHWAPGVDPFAAVLPLQQNDALQTIQLRPGALSPEECAKVIEIGENMPRVDGRVELGPAAYRVSHITWIEPRPDTHWLFHKLGGLFIQAGADFGFELSGFVDALQYTVYGPEQHFDWHMDLGPGLTSARKLSLTLQLSDADAYTGGALEFINAPTAAQVREGGAATFFPSYLVHRVSPVKHGVRRSLVAWACGPVFR